MRTKFAARPATWGMLLALLLGTVAPAAAQERPDRSVPPVPGPPPSLELPPVQRFELSNGLPVVLMEKHEVPLVQFAFVIDAGSVREGAGEQGLASATFDLMQEGAGRYDALELADAVDFLGADLSASAGYHTARVAMRTPVSRMDTALAILGDVVLRPTFVGEEVDRYRLERLTSLVQAHDQPTALASVAFDRALYGETHPYGAPRDAEAALRALGADDVRRFHDAYVRPDNATLVVVGDVTPATLRPALEAVFGGWAPGDVPPAPEVAEPEQVSGRRIVLVDKPGAAQSVVRIGRIGVPRTTEDYFTLQVLNTVLGGSFTSRLNQNLREDKGYSYGAGSSFAYRPAPGPFSAGASVQTDVTGPAVAEFMKELRAIREPVPDDELVRARNYVALRYPSSFQTVAGVAGELAELVEYDLPASYLDGYTNRLLAVTPADVHAAARRYVDPDHLVIVVVGDREVIEPQLRALELGPIELLDAEDVLGPVPGL